MTHFFARNSALLAVLLLGACQELGPASLEHARPNYNSAIQDTQKKEVLSNIVRVAHGEPTLFVNVSEIDATVSLQASETSQISGGSIAAGSFTGPAFSYTDQPIIKYAPLNGEELVDQIATPVTESSLSQLLDSNWHLVPVLQFTIDRIAPQYVGMGAVLNAIAQLNDYHALSITSVVQRNGLTGLSLYLLPDNPSIAPVSDLIFDRTGARMAAGQTRVAVLAARQNILLLWIRLLRIYEDTQPANARGGCQITASADSCLAKLQAEISLKDEKGLEAVFKELPGRIDLLGDVAISQKSDASDTSDKAKTLAKIDSLPRDIAPVLHTRSALGVLKASTRGGGGIAIFDMDNPVEVAKVETMSKQVSDIRGRCFIWPDFYISKIPASALEDPDYRDDRNFVNNTVSKSACTLETLYRDGGMNIDDFRAVRREFMLLSARDFILIRRSAAEPVEAYVTYYDGKSWFYIANDDDVSKLNFLLMSQLLTMQAVATSQSTTPLAITTH